MSFAENKQIAQNFIDEIWNKGNLEGPSRFVTPDIIYHARGEDVTGIENFKKWVSTDRSIFPDIRFIIVDSISEFNKVATSWIVEATHQREYRGIRATHKKFKTVGFNIFHFEGNKIKEAWIVVDGLTPALQLGVVKTESSETLLLKFLSLPFWNKTISAEDRIEEIEEGTVSNGLRLIENQDEIIKEVKRKNNSANKLSICSTFGGMQMGYNHLFDSYKNVVDKHRRGESKEGMRWIISIDKESIDLVKIFLNAGIQVRHVKNIPPMNFGVSDQEIAVTLEKMEGGKMSQSFLISNDPLYINHFNSLFDELWKNGIDAKDRIQVLSKEILVI